MSIGQNTEKAQVLLENLNSPFWFVRSRALKEFELINSSEFLREVYLQTEHSHDDSLRWILLDGVGICLLSTKVEIIGEALLILILEYDQKNNKIKNEAKRKIKSFFENQDIYRYLKVLGLRHCLEHLPRNKRKLVTSIVGEFKVFEVVPLLLENFNSKDNDLKKLTIEVLRKLSDRRGNRYLKEILNDPHSPEIELAIRAFGSLGSPFDFRSITTHLSHHHPKTRIAAVIAVCKMLKVFALPFMYSTYKKASTISLKREIVHQVGKIHHPLSAKFLLHFYNQEEDFNLVQQFDWAFHEMPKQRTIPVIIKNFEKQSETTQFRLVRMLGEFNDKSCITLLEKILSSEIREIVLIESFDVAVIFNSQKLLNIMLKYEDSQSPHIRHYAILSILKHTCFDRLNYYRKWLAAENLPISLIQLLIKFADDNFSEIKANESIYSDVQAFLKKSVLHSHLDVLISAIDCSWQYMDTSLFQTLFHLFEHEKKTLLIRSYSLCFIKAMTENAYLLALNPEILNNGAIVKRIQPAKLGHSFWKIFLQCFRENSFHWFDHFWEAHSLSVGNALITWISQTKSFDYLPEALELIRKSNVDLEESFLDFMVSEIYIWSDQTVKYQILSCLAEFGRLSDFYFLWNESNKSELFPNQHSHLISLFVEAVE